MSFGVFLICMSVVLILKPFYAQAAHTPQVWVWVLILLMSGAVLGFISGLMGVGGGAIMVPAMVVVLGFGQHLAQGSAAAGHGAGRGHGRLYPLAA